VTAALPYTIQGGEVTQEIRYFRGTYPEIIGVAAGMEYIVAMLGSLPKTNILNSFSVNGGRHRREYMYMVAVLVSIRTYINKRTVLSHTPCGLPHTPTAMCLQAP
jgi:hypothetical protein